MVVWAVSSVPRLAPDSAPQEGAGHHLLKPGPLILQRAHRELSSSALLSHSKTWAPRLDSSLILGRGGQTRVCQGSHQSTQMDSQRGMLRGSRLAPEIQLKEVCSKS